MSLGNHALGFVNPWVRHLSPYVPGLSSEQIARAYDLKKVVKLASNENSWGPAPQVLSALKDFFHHQGENEEWGLYPDSQYLKLRTSIAERYGISSEAILVGNGSNECIDLIFRGLACPGDRVLSSQYSFVAYKISAQSLGLQYDEVPVKENFDFDQERLLEYLKKYQPRILVLAVPNNPTGACLSLDQLIELAEMSQKTQTYFLLDDAYGEYLDPLDQEARWDLLKQYPHLLLLKTFSKVHGLAALRVGYAAGYSSLIQELLKVRPPFNVNTVGAMAASVALNQISYETWVREQTCLEREKFEEALKEALGVKVIPSQGNFLLVDFGKKIDELHEKCLRSGLILRPVKNYGLPHHLRITIGKPDENNFCIKILKECFK